MAVIGKLRKRAGLVVMLIGIAMGLFVLMDALRTSFMGQDDTVAIIDGEKVSLMEYQTILDRVEERFRFFQGEITPEMQEQIHMTAWEILILEKLIKPRLEEMGISVTEEELTYALTSDNPHPLIRQQFTDPQTGIYNPQFVQNFLAYIQQNPNSREAELWQYIKELIYYDLIRQKYVNSIAKGWYIPTWFAQEAQVEALSQASAQAVFVPYSLIPDDSISYTEEELHDLIQDKFKEFALKTPVRYVYYVAFPIVPYERDSLAALEFINQCLEQWKTVSPEEEADFIARCSEQPWDDRFWHRDQLGETPFTDSFFTLPIGTILGPYVEMIGGQPAYLAYKIIDRKEVPDSVEFRQIFVQAVTQSKRQEVRELLDSLKEVIEAGHATFDSLAVKFSHDPGSAQRGGYVGWVTGAMLMPELRNEILYKDRKEGELFIAESRAGLHLIKIERFGNIDEGVKVGTIIRFIGVSDQTLSEILNEASRFYSIVSENPDSFVQIAQREGYNPIKARLVPEQFNVPGLGPARPLVRWAFQNDEGDLSDVLELERAFVVAYLYKAYDKGEIPDEDIKEMARQKLINIKKQAILMKRLRSAQTVEDISTLTEMPIQNVSFSFQQDFVPGIGMERKFIGAAFGVSPGTEIPIVLGDNGIIKAKVENIDVPKNLSPDIYKQQLFNSWNIRVQQLWLRALSDYEEVEDLRYRHF
ncbi:MAG: hypothetical protein GXO48_01570 [Chlorobi bacterium]|nr:hypothetical protein [Chlorobiota bacterium]